MGGVFSKKKRSKEPGKHKTRRKAPMLDIFWRLFPFFNDSEDGHLGRFEIILMFLVSILRTWHQTRVVGIKSNLLMATYKGDTKLFYRIMMETGILSLIASAIYATHKYLKERLALIWREKLTKQLHTSYFNKMAYYKLSHLNEAQIADVEERIVKDPRRFCKALAEEMEKFSAACTSGIWFTYQLMTISSLGFSISPLMYFIGAFKAALYFVPEWSQKWRQMLDLRAQYFGTHSRLQMHAEAICAYQGNNIERGIINKAWRKFINYCYVFLEDATLYQFVASALFEYGAETFGLILVTACFAGPEAQHTWVAKHHGMTIAEAAALRGSDKTLFKGALTSQIRFVVDSVAQAMKSQGIIMTVVHQLMQMRGPARRMTTLFDTLEKFSVDNDDYFDETFVDDRNTIAFKDAQVYTPTGNLLLKDLNFEIKKGTNMLVTGCNGSGKSSLFRCLGGLWELRGGQVTKPGGSKRGLNKSVFYLPQKPYNVLGTLRQQICYPLKKELAKNMTDAELTELLTSVDLAYLMERGPQGPKDDKEVDWDAKLSMGEKQRLAMARLFYHKPEFAILDECTSGVSADMEKRLYDACAERRITCITISHRPVLRQYHKKVLNILKDSKGGWTWNNTDENTDNINLDVSLDLSKSAEAAEKTAEKAAASKIPRTESFARMEQLNKENRSRKYKTKDSPGEASSDEASAGNGTLFPELSTFHRLKLVLAAFFPQGVSYKDKEILRVLLLCGIVAAKTMTANLMSLNDGYTFWTIIQGNWRESAYALCRRFVIGLALSFLDAAVERNKWYLNLQLRQRLTKHLIDMYFEGNTFYDVTNQDGRIAIPEERLTDQVESLSITLTSLWTQLFRPAFDITFNSVVLYRAVGLQGLSYILSYMGVAAIVMRYMVPNFRQSTRESYRREDRFRYVHTRLVQHTESIAFFGGSEVEHEVCNDRFNHLRDHARRSLMETYKFNFFNHSVVRQTPDLIAYSLHMHNAGSSSLTVVKSDNIGPVAEYISQTVKRTFRSFGDAFELQETLGSFVGTLENITDTMLVLQKLARKQGLKKRGLVQSTDGNIEFRGVDIVSPTGTCCCSGLSFAVQKGKPLIVTGPNGSGKSSLFRTLGGLWAIPEGEISRPCQIGNGTDKDDQAAVVTPKQIFLVPQKPYHVRGSLADQITYPESLKERTAEEEQKLMDLLKLVGIDYLVERWSWFKAVVAAADETTGYTVKITDEGQLQGRVLTALPADKLRASRTTSKKKRRSQAKRNANADKSTKFGKGDDVEALVIFEDGRLGGWEKLQKWEDVLSLGEQQRTGCARLFYHQPQFAVLDECTSAVSIDIERILYKAAHDRAITSITISQRLALEEFHHQELRLGDAESLGWSLHDIAQSPKPQSPKPQSPEQTEAAKVDLPEPEQTEAAKADEAAEPEQTEAAKVDLPEPEQTEAAKVDLPEPEASQDDSMATNATEVAHQVFQDVDKNNDGFLTKTELRKYFKKHPAEKTRILGSDFHWNDFFTDMDTNGDNKFDVDEFTDFILRKMSDNSEAGYTAGQRKKKEKELIAALNVLSADDLNELKGLDDLPKAATMAMEAVLILLHGTTATPTAAEIKKALADATFMDNLVKFDKDAIAPEVLQKLETYLRDPEFSKEQIHRRCAAAASFCSWVHAVTAYAQQTEAAKADEAEPEV